eukprot:GHUV01030096.1.p1 GENE.GHUV01030096.1~~GHUV01030096.1.p1  ORF type:complete len:134 (-),score=22.81 GHUV01030096.1:190-591(-)
MTRKATRVRSRNSSKVLKYWPKVSMLYAGYLADKALATACAYWYVGTPSVAVPWWYTHPLRTCVAVRTDCTMLNSFNKGRLSLTVPSLAAAPTERQRVARGSQQLQHIAACGKPCDICTTSNCRGRCTGYQKR